MARIPRQGFITEAHIEVAETSSKTIFIIRSDENSDYDREKANDYLARLKKVIASDLKNPSNPVVMIKETAKPDRTHIEILEVSKDKVREHEEKGFAKA